MKKWKATICIFFFNLLGIAQTSFLYGSEDNFLLTKEITDKDNVFSQTSFKNAVQDNYGFFWIATEMGLYKYDGLAIKKVIDSRYPEISKNRIIGLGNDYHTGDVIFVVFPSDNIYTIKNQEVHKLDIEKCIFSENNKCILPNSFFTKKIISELKLEKRIKYFTGYNRKSIIKLKDKYFIGVDKTLCVFIKNKKSIKLNFPNTKKILLLRIKDNILLIDCNKKKSNFYNVTIQNNNTINLTPVKVSTIFSKYIDSIVKNDNIALVNNYLLCDQENYFLNLNNKIFKIDFIKNELVVKYKSKNPNNDQFFFCKAKKDFILCNNFSKKIFIQYPNYFNIVRFNETDKDNNYAVAILDRDTWTSTNNWSFNYRCKRIIEHLPRVIDRHFLLPLKKKIYYCGKYSQLTEIKTNIKLGFDIEDGSTYKGYTYLQKRLWVYSDKTLTYLDGTKFIKDEFFKKYINKNINNVYAFNQNLIVGTHKGVYNYIPFVKLSPIKGLENVYARYFKTINKNTFFVGCYSDGLFLVQNDKVFKVQDKRNDLSSVHAIEEDSRSNLWITTNNGLLVVEKAKALDCILNNKPISTYRFTTDDGLPTNEFNGGGTHPSLQTEEGIIGFTSIKGYVWFDPLKVKRHLFKEKVFLEKLVIDNKQTIPNKSGKYKIPKEAKILDFVISFPYYFNRDNITVEYRISGEQEWKEVKDNSFQLARENDGIKEVYIKIHTHGFDTKEDVIQKITLQFEPKYYETTWFLILIFFIVLLVAFGAFKIGLIINKNNRIKLEAIIKQKTAQLEETNNKLLESMDNITKSLEEKEILLKEIHHRVKNNLQLVISILSIQARKGNFESIDEFIGKAQSRITSMSLIHEILYQSDSLAKVEFAKYVEVLIMNVKDSYQSEESIIEIHNELESDINFQLSTSISLGLIMNELLTNIFKHAFKSQQCKPKIWIRLKELSSKSYILEICDNGSGYKLDEIKKKSFGIQLVQILTKQLQGSFEVVNDKQTINRIIFSDLEE